jgi:hypothetical protein
MRIFLVPTTCDLALLRCTMGLPWLHLTLQKGPCRIFPVGVSCTVMLLSVRAMYIQPVCLPQKWGLSLFLMVSFFCLPATSRNRLHVDDDATEPSGK